jgi:hypothetical protein
LSHESTVSVISYGGGVQSTALVVLATQGKIPHRLALFCNVGDDSENPDTLVYVREHVIPWAAERGVEVRELQRIRRNGQVETLMERLHRNERSIDIPIRMSNGSPGNRKCTGDFKIAVVAKELRRMGATNANPVNVALGISIDEYQRMRGSTVSCEVLDYPLIDMRLDRAACQRIIQEAGLPPAPKSSCFFCPFKTRRQWQELRVEQPELFEKTVRLEQMINERRAKMGKDSVWMTSSAKPLDEAVTDTGQLEMFATCDVAGYCHI